jgi:hypothetical protein
VPKLSVSIIRFVDECQPGIVACEFIDANQRKHTLIDKVPIFSELSLWSDSLYPQPGTTDCRVLESFRDERGRELLRIISVESVDGETEFVVERAQVSEDSAT